MKFLQPDLSKLHEEEIEPIDDSSDSDEELQKRKKCIANEREKGEKRKEGEDKECNQEKPEISSSSIPKIRLSEDECGFY